MKTLLLMRHAKSSWKESELDDHDRGLSGRGKKDAPRMGELLQEENLLPVLYADQWDATNKRWLTPNPPTPWKAYTLFMDEVLSVTIDKASDMVTIGVEWKDPALAAAWVRSLIVRETVTAAGVMPVRKSTWLVSELLLESITVSTP